MGLTNSSVGKKAIKKQGFISGCDYTIALAGNPNTGKSTIFNGLTGMNQHTGNWTGKTVESAYGICTYNNQKFLLVDLPGTYSLMADSEEEVIAKDYIKSGVADITVVVIDATRLERNLNLVYQVFNLTDNVIICVNLIDEAKKKGITIDLKQLSIELGVPVIGTIGKKKNTLVNILKSVKQVVSNNVLCNPIKVEQNIDMIFSKAHEVSQKVCLYSNADYNNRDKKIDKILTSKKYGIPIMLIFFCFIFWITIVGANYPSKILSNLFECIQPYIYHFFSWIRLPSWLVSLLIDGIYKTVTWIVSVMLPPMAIFFPLFTLLEDIGYLPRIAFNLDKCFQKCQTSGKQALTMCMGFGCNSAGVVGCRIIASPRERLIAILTNCFVPCNGRFPLLITIATIFFSGAMFKRNRVFSSIVSTLIVACIVLIGIGFTFLVSSILSKALLKGKSEGFVLELPPYRKPKVLDILVHSFVDRTLFVLGRALSVALPAGIFIWILSNIYIGNLNLLNYVANFFDPFAKLMGLDGYILTAFILGFPANEIVLPIILMSYTQGSSLVEVENVHSVFEILSSHNWTAITALNVMLFSLLHFPCGTTLLTIFKETKSKKWTLLSFALPTICGILVCMCTNLGWWVGSLIN